MPPEGDLPDYLDETHQRISEFAADYLDEDEREDFVNQLLERHGYQQNTVTTWMPPEPSSRGGSGQGGGRKPLVKPRTPQGQGGGGQRRGSYFGGTKRS